jgi:exodeoxyribonuclease V gamma subunit
LLQGRLGVQLPQAEAELEDEEPLLPDGLDRYQLAENLLPYALQGATPAALKALALAGPQWPDGLLGESLLQGETTRLERYAETLRPDLSAEAESGGTFPDTLEFRFPLKEAGVELTGSLRHWGGRGLLRYRCARAKAGDYLAAWLDHLCFQLAAPENASRVTSHIALDRRFLFRPVDAPQSLLSDWIAAWRTGQSEPLPFYPQTAWAWMTAGEGKGKLAWQGSAYQNGERRGEQQDPWWQLALRGKADVLGEDFVRLAEGLLTPLLEHLEHSP